MRELITAAVLALRWLGYVIVTLLIPVVVMVPLVAGVNALPAGPYTAAGLSGLGLLVAATLIRRLWLRYLRRSGGTRRGRYSLP